MVLCSAVLRPIVVSFACFNFSSNIAPENLLNLLVVTFLSWSGIFFSIS